MNVEVTYIGLRKTDQTLKKNLEKVLQYLAQNIAIKIDATVTVKFVGKDAICKLNKQYRNVDKATDVLSFPFYELHNGKDIFGQIKNDKSEFEFSGSYHFGDIVICRSIAKLRTKQYGYANSNEVCFLAAHGFLHLAGYDHQTQEDEDEMTGICVSALDFCGIKNEK